MMKRFLFSLFLTISVFSCAPTTRKNMTPAPGIDIASAKRIAIEHLKTVVSAESFLPESTTVDEKSKDDQHWSVYIKKSDWRHIEPPVFLISVDKKTGQPEFMPLE
jgi:hypothetical protein